MCQVGGPVSREAGRFFTRGCFTYGRVLDRVNQVATAPQALSVVNATANATAASGACVRATCCSLVISCLLLARNFVRAIVRIERSVGSSFSVTPWH